MKKSEQNLFVLITVVVLASAFFLYFSNFSKLNNMTGFVTVYGSVNPATNYTWEWTPEELKDYSVSNPKQFEKILPTLSGEMVEAILPALPNMTQQKYLSSQIEIFAHTNNVGVTLTNNNEYDENGNYLSLNLTASNSINTTNILTDLGLLGDINSVIATGNSTTKEAIKKIVIINNAPLSIGAAYLDGTIVLDIPTEGIVSIGNATQGPINRTDVIILTRYLIDKDIKDVEQASDISYKDWSDAAQELADYLATGGNDAVHIADLQAKIKQAEIDLKLAGYSLRDKPIEVTGAENYYIIIDGEKKYYNPYQVGSKMGNLGTLYPSLELAEIDQSEGNTADGIVTEEEWQRAVEKASEDYNDALSNCPNCVDYTKSVLELIEAQRNFVNIHFDVKVPSVPPVKLAAGGVIVGD